MRSLGTAGAILFSTLIAIVTAIVCFIFFLALGYAVFLFSGGVQFFWISIFALCPAVSIFVGVMLGIRIYRQLTKTKMPQTQPPQQTLEVGLTTTLSGQNKMRPLDYKDSLAELKRRALIAEEEEAQFTWAVCWIIAPLVAISAVAGVFVFLSAALEKRFSGGSALLIVFSLSCLLFAIDKMKKAKRQMTALYDDLSRMFITINFLNRKGCDATDITVGHLKNYARSSTPALVAGFLHHYANLHPELVEECAAFSEELPCSAVIFRLRSYASCPKHAELAALLDSFRGKIHNSKCSVAP